jgi:hypothetical protein
MSRPPFAERILLGFLADPALGDAILGDLTEEWRTRITRDGRVSANRWYWGQAIRTMPHLLRDWCVNATRRDVRLRLAGILVVFGIAALPAAAAHVMANINLAVARLMFPVLWTTSATAGWSASDGRGQTMPLTLNWLEIAGIPLAVSATCALAGAYVLGARTRIAPLVSVFWLGAAWIAVSAAVPLALRWPSWYFVALPAVLAVGTASGGVLAMLRPLHAARSSAPSSLD